MDRPIGTGPGEITDDGCAVDFYALLPPFGEPEIIHEAVPPGASILELGCGTGRLLRPLAELGHPVFGVDQSQGMLDHLAGLPTQRSLIETVRLGRTFDAVLLAATMINVAPDRRHRFLATCRAHLREGGIAVFQYNPPDWFETLSVDEPRVREETGGIRVILRSARRVPPRMFAEVEYQVGDRVWTHAWGSYEIGSGELTANLAAAGLAFGRWLTDDHRWFTAIAVTGGTGQ